MLATISMEIMTYLKIISQSPLPKTLSSVSFTLEIFTEFITI